MHKAFWIIFLAALTLAAPFALAAATDTRNVQIQLKNRGFYYGEADGVSGPETEAALRRFQIRNGLSVTGTLTEETSRALNQPPSASAPRPGGSSTAPVEEFSETDQEFLRSQRSSPRTTPTPAPTPTPSRYTTRERERDEERERRYSRYRYEPSRESYDDYDDRDGYVAPPVSIPHPTGGDAYMEILYGTVYEDAPREVQRTIVQRAQNRLARLRYYRGAIDGLPGPATEEALASFQDDGRRRVTGRLDMATLDDLGLLSRRRGPTLQFGIQFGDNRVFRGVEISP